MYIQSVPFPLFMYHIYTDRLTTLPSTFGARALGTDSISMSNMALLLCLFISLLSLVILRANCKYLTVFTTLANISLGC